MAGDTNVVTVSVSYLKELEAYKEAYIRLNGVLDFPTFDTVRSDSFEWNDDGKWFKYPPAPESEGK